jgi:hypothetical protein
MEGLLTQVASSVLIGLLSWGGSQLLTMYKARNAQTRPAAPATGSPVPGSPQPFPSPNGEVYAAQPPAPSINYSQVLIHIGILQLVVNIVGLIIGFMVGALFGTSDTGLFLILIFFFGTLVASIMFFIFGLRVDRAVRWRHLSLVALGTIPLTLFVNWLATAVSGQTLYTNVAEFVGAVIIAFVQTFLSMGIGGGLAALVDPKRRVQAPPAPMAPQYLPNAYPYTYGPPAAAPSTPLGYPPGAAPYPSGYPGAYPPSAYPPNPAGYPGAPYPSGGYPPSPSGYPPNPAYPPPAAYPPSPAGYPPPPGYPGAYPPSSAGYPAYPPNPGYAPPSQPLAGYPPTPDPSAPVNPAGGPAEAQPGTGPAAPDQPGYTPPSSTS